MTELCRRVEPTCAARVVNRCSFKRPRNAESLKERAAQFLIGQSRQEVMTI